ncbi:MAG TPA: GNAT family N-acetyltransferase [Steroidobacteraceae bacterium]|jgi:CelD/BcsL family acetyltransferase involved in cellulose biosynthesis
MPIPFRLTKSIRFGRPQPEQGANDITVEIVDNIGDLVALQSDYELLLPLSGNKLPFSLHEWHVAWCNQFLEHGKYINTNPMICVARDSNRRCVAIVPMIRTRRAIGPLKIDTLDLLGADPAVTEIRTSIIQPSYETRAVWAIQRKLANLDSVAWVSWGGVTDTCAGALAVGAEIQLQEPLLDYVLDLPPTWEEFRVNLKRNVRESIRHCYNSLHRDGLECELRVIEDPERVADALQRFFELHAMRAELKGTVPHADHFARGRPRRFLCDVCARLAARGTVRIFQLTIRDEVVATRIGFLVRGSLYLYYSGFDPRWAKYGVMTTTLVETLKYAIEQRIATVNLSTGKDCSKTRWRPREIAIAQAVQIGSSPLSRLAWQGFQRLKADQPLPSWVSKLVRQSTRDWG